MEERPQIERGTVSPRDTRHCEAHPRSIRDKRLPREACFDLGDDEVEMKRRMKSQLNAARCLPGTHATVRLTQKAFVTSGSRVKRFLTWVMSKWRTSLLPFMMWRKKTLSWRKDRKFNAARCCTGTHATVRCTKETFVTSDSRVKRDLTWAMSKRRKIL